MELKNVDLEIVVDSEIVADINTKRYAKVGKQMENVEVIVANSITPNLVNFI